MSETIRCARCDRRLPMEDAERELLPDPAEPWAAPNEAEGQVYLLVCPDCAAVSPPPTGERPNES